MTRKYSARAQSTKYGLYYYRSKLEAQWAVFFDCLGIKYEYEPEGGEVESYRGGYVWYRPDFLLPEHNKYIEIKHSKPVESENLKAAAWSFERGDIYLLFNLNVPTEANENGWRFEYINDLNKPPILTKGFYWSECPRCGHIDLADEGEIISCGCFSDEEHNTFYEKDQTPNFTRSERLKRAYRLAKGHDFKGEGRNRVTRIDGQRRLFD